MHPAIIEEVLTSMTLLVDTREQPTELFNKRIEAVGLPHVRQKLNSGDYSAKVTLPSGEDFSLEDLAVIERKMSLDELAMCLGTERKRFVAEFERSKARIYLLVEGGSWEKIYRHQYRSRLNVKAYVASLLAFTARYNATLIFCTKERTGEMIHDILYREMKEHLKEVEE